ncbi:19694_t:CDS:1, partial [Racocetra fulgida]
KKNGSMRSTDAKFNIEPKQVRNWREKKEMLMQARPHIKCLGGGLRAKYPELEAIILS